MVQVCDADSCEQFRVLDVSDDVAFGVALRDGYVGYLRLTSEPEGVNVGFRFSF